MDLQKTVDYPAQLAAFLVNRFQQFQAIDAVNQVNKRGDIFYLVGLQMSNEMPADICRQYRLLTNQFLHIIFSEVALPQFIEGCEILHRFGFGDCDEGGMGSIQFAQN